MTIRQEPFGRLSDGQDARLYLLDNGHGVSLALTDYGARIVRLLLPDRDGAVADVALGYDSVAPYEKQEDYFGATCGRVANRIANARFSLGQESFSLSKNDGGNTLHGGFSGLTRVLWGASPVKNGVRFSFVSPDGAEGFPGRLSVSCTYELAGDDRVRITYHAQSDRDTPVSLANHTYFNLAGHGAGSILGHVLQLYAAYFTPVDRSLLPTGELRPVLGTPFDFTTPRQIGKRIGEADEQLLFGAGYDHNFALPANDAGTLQHAATLFDPSSGRRMDVSTTMPGVQVYTANMLQARTGKGGAAYGRRGAICIETQHFPNAVNVPAFPSPVLRAGAAYEHVTELRFSTGL